jgi:hypothetical protein
MRALGWEKGCVFWEREGKCAMGTGESTSSYKQYKRLAYKILFDDIHIHRHTRLLKMKMEGLQ